MSGRISVKDLGREQKYISFLNYNRMKASRLWNDMQTRCYNVQRIIDIKTEMSEMVARTNKMLKYNEERRKEHEEQMKWLDRQ